MSSEAKKDQPLDQAEQPVDDQLKEIHKDTEKVETSLEANKSVDYKQLVKPSVQGALEAYLTKESALESDSNLLKDSSSKDCKSDLSQNQFKQFESVQSIEISKEFVPSKSSSSSILLENSMKRSEVAAVEKDTPVKLSCKCSEVDEKYTGFDSVVKNDKLVRKSTFPPNSKKVSKPSNILIDIYGVISPWSFANELKKFANANIGCYIREQWNSKLVKNTVARMREQINIDRMAGHNVPVILPESFKLEDVIESAVESIQWQLEHKHSTTRGQVERLCADLWSQSYDNGKLKPTVYPDVTDAFNYWRFEEFIKIYSYASGTVEGQRQFLRASAAGDLNRFIANGLNSSGGYKFDANKFRSVSAALREPKPQNLLYITDDPKKARNAIHAGLRSVVVNRNNSSSGKYEPHELVGLTVVNNINEIEFISEPDHIPDCC